MPGCPIVGCPDHGAAGGCCIPPDQADGACGMPCWGMPCGGSCLLPARPVVAACGGIPGCWPQGLAGGALRRRGPSALLRHTGLLRAIGCCCGMPGCCGIGCCGMPGWPGQPPAAGGCGICGTVRRLSPEIGRRLRRLRLSGPSAGNRLGHARLHARLLRHSRWHAGWLVRLRCRAAGARQVAAACRLHPGCGWLRGWAGWPGQPPCAGGVNETRRNKPTACRPHCGQLKG